jgi:hypothetical protein
MALATLSFAMRSRTAIITKRSQSASPPDWATQIVYRYRCELSLARAAFAHSCARSWTLLSMTSRKKFASILWRRSPAARMERQPAWCWFPLQERTNCRDQRLHRTCARIDRQVQRARGTLLMSGLHCTSLCHCPYQQHRHQHRPQGREHQGELHAAAQDKPRPTFARPCLGRIYSGFAVWAEPDDTPLVCILLNLRLRNLPAP